MSMEVKIHKKLGEYELDVYWKSKKKRIGILGASGSGKSLTLKSIAGIEHPHSLDCHGSLCLCEKDQFRD